MKNFTNADGIALMLLAAERLGVNPTHLSDAKGHLEGVPQHPMTMASMERECCRINDLLRVDSAKIEQANLHLEILRNEYGFATEISREAFLCLQDEAEQLELAHAKGQDLPHHKDRLETIFRVMSAAQWTLHPDYGCVLISEANSRDRAVSM